MQDAKWMDKVLESGICKPNIKKDELVIRRLFMKHKKIYIIILSALVLLVLMLFVIYFNQKDRPSSIIKRELNLSLPSTSKIINYYYDRRDEYFMAKVQISERDINNIKEDLKKHFKNEHIIKNKNEIPHFENNASWWDMNKNGIEVCYFTFLSGKHIKSIEVWVFIVRQCDGKYYLYIAN